MNRNRIIKETTDSRTYRLLTTINPDPYYDECWGTHYRGRRNSVPGSKNYFSWKRKTLYNFEYRQYRTWKHNRKTQWKNQKNVNSVDQPQIT